MFKKVLIANRGEIALRVIRTAQEMGIETVAVYSEADRNALHVRRATRAVCIGTPKPADSYLAIDKILAAAISTQCDHQQQGHGARLVAHLLHLARHAGARSVFLEVRISNGAAFRLYHKMGFNEIGLRKGYYPAQDGREDALVLAREL